MIGEVALAIEMGADAVDIGKTIHPHPTLGEIIGMAAEVAHGVVHRPAAAAPVAVGALADCGSADVGAVQAELTSPPVVEEEAQGLAHGPKGNFVPRHLVFAKQPRLQRFAARCQGG